MTTTKPTASLIKTDLKARDVMTAEPVCVERSTTIRELWSIFDQNEISGVPVVDQQGRAIGVVSKTDLLRRYSEGNLNDAASYLFETLAEQGDVDAGKDIASEPRFTVNDVMTESPIVVGPETPVAEVARRMYDARVHRMIVVDRLGIPIGIITSLDLLRVFPGAA
ncbi:MAG: CBS domain-containing protein [Phycisphaerales bacterium]